MKQDELKRDGFTIHNNIYTSSEIKQLISSINQADQSKSTFRKSGNLFAIRQFLKEVPGIIPFIFNDKLKSLIAQFLGSGYFSVKSIYFDKPEQSNWFVAYHQDLTISVDKKIALDNYGPWTVKQNQFAVQPPLEVLNNLFTLRIHLDDTGEDNGALKVIPSSHLKGIYRPETIDWSIEKETVCRVNKGGVMIMRPLLLHSSSRAVSNMKRRVIHIEFSNMELPDGLAWAEKICL